MNEKEKSIYSWRTGTPPEKVKWKGKPVQTLAEMSPEKQAEMRRLYNKGPSNEVRPNKRRGFILSDRNRRTRVVR